MEVDFGDCEDENGFGVHAFLFKAGAQRLVCGDLGGAIDADHVLFAGDEEHERDVRVAHDVAQRVEAVVAAPVGHQQGFGVCDADHGAVVAAWCGVCALWSDGGQDAEARGVDPCAVVGRDDGRDFGQGGGGGVAVERFEVGDAVDGFHERRFAQAARGWQPSLR